MCKKTDVQIKLSFNEHSIIKKYNFLAIISCEGIAGFFCLFACLFTSTVASFFRPGCDS